jgi:outer membrane protein assembly factor BamB
MPRRPLFLAPAILCVLNFRALPLLAENDWPQWGGPDRNFTVEAPKLADSWEARQPRLLWSRPLGEGYSALGVSGGKAWTLYHENGREVAIALRADTGETLWEYAYDAPLLSGMAMENGAGPHSSPLLAGGRIFTIGVTGKLNCLDQDTGRRIWGREVITEFGGTVLGRGYSSSPIAYKDSVIVMAGGPDHAVVAFRQGDGALLWHRHSFRISHSSPILIRRGSRDQLVAIVHQQMVGLDPEDGALLWSLPQPVIGDHIASLPLWDGGSRLFFSCAYDGGSRGVELDKDAGVSGGGSAARETWFTSKMRIHHSNAILKDGCVYGPSGDFGAVLYSAIDLATGEILWKDRSVGRAGAVWADGKLLLLDEEGRLILASASRAGLKILSTLQVFNERSWTPPALVGNKLYLRNRKTIQALELP